MRITKRRMNLKDTDGDDEDEINYQVKTNWHGTATKPKESIS